MDHLVYAVPDVDAAVAEIARLSGVAPVEGGRHVGMGTHNFLLGLGGGAYLEIVGPDPEQGEVGAPRPFGIDRLSAPRLVAWAIRVPDIDAAVATARTRGLDPGEPATMSRRTPEGELLAWRLTAPPAGLTLLPFLIDWGSTPHPTSRGLPEVALGSFTGYHPDPGSVRDKLSALDAEIEVHEGAEPELSAVLIGDGGPLTLR